MNHFNQIILARQSAAYILYFSELSEFLLELCFHQQMILIAISIDRHTFFCSLAIHGFNQK